jgi:hypothetical protein
MGDSLKCSLWKGAGESGIVHFQELVSIGHSVFITIQAGFQKASFILSYAIPNVKTDLLSLLYVLGAVILSRVKGFILELNIAYEIRI